MKEKTAKRFHFMLSLLRSGGFQQNLENVVKNSLTIISNDPGFKLFITLKLLKILQKVHNVRGLFLLC